PLRSESLTASLSSMSYQTAIERMYALGHELAQAPSHKFDLAHMRVLLAALENPERRSSGVLIAGTNGKGSTAATLASILGASGLRTGLYTSQSGSPQDGCQRRCRRSFAIRPRDRSEEHTSEL